LFDYKAQLKRDLDNRRETKEVSKISLEFSKTKLEPDSMNLTYNETRAKEAQKSFEKVQKRYNSIVELYKEVEQSQELIEIFGNYEGTLWEQQKNNSELER
jgi:t-SNARE complex subunit (syntaxin)